MARKRVTPIVVRSAVELANALGFTTADAVEWDLRIDLANKISSEMRRGGLTHIQVARLAGTSRTKITAVANGNLAGISTDLLLRIVTALGFRSKLSFTKLKRAA